MCCSEWRNEILHPTGTWDMVASLFSISALSASHSVAIRVSQHLTGTSSNDGGDGCVCLSMLSLFHSQCPPGSSRLLHLTDAPALLGLRLSSSIHLWVDTGSSASWLLAGRSHRHGMGVHVPSAHLSAFLWTCAWR
jgi:hypothetical protein